MKLLLAEDNSGYVLESMDENLKNMAVPAGLFFLQRAFEEQTPTYKLEKGSDEMAPCSLYDRLYTLVEDKSTRKTRRHKKKHSTKKNKTKKNN